VISSAPVTWGSTGRIMARPAPQPQQPGSHPRERRCRQDPQLP
jgi:hypothetical protein